MYPFELALWLVLDELGDVLEQTGCDEHIAIHHDTVVLLEDVRGRKGKREDGMTVAHVRSGDLR